jgi:hypothetical protein
VFPVSAQVEQPDARHHLTVVIRYCTTDSSSSSNNNNQIIAKIPVVLRAQYRKSCDVLFVQFLEGVSFSDKTTTFIEISIHTHTSYLDVYQYRITHQLNYLLTSTIHNTPSVHDIYPQRQQFLPPLKLLKGVDRIWHYLSVSIDSR